jgi:hypothetical protein
LQEEKLRFLLAQIQSSVDTEAEFSSTSNDSADKSHTQAMRGDKIMIMMSPILLTALLLNLQDQDTT